MQVAGYAQFGGQHGESAALKNLLAHAVVVNPGTGAPFTEALCFGIGGVIAGDAQVMRPRLLLSLPANVSR